MNIENKHTEYDTMTYRLVLTEAMFALLTPENKEIVNLQIETLAASQSSNQ